MREAGEASTAGGNAGGDRSDALERAMLMASVGGTGGRRGEQEQEAGRP